MQVYILISLDFIGLCCCKAVFAPTQSDLVSRPRTSTIGLSRGQLHNFSGVPLQSDKWSLADYVVKPGDFECLQFSQIDNILSNDDVVRYVNLGSLASAQP